MVDPADRVKGFEARLDALKHRMEAGLGARADELRRAAERLSAGEETAREEIRRLSHKLRGIAGTYGHAELTELAADLEQRARHSPAPAVAELARGLAEEAERIGSDTDLTTAGAAPAQVRTSQAAGPAADAAPDSAAPLRVLGMDDEPNTQKLLELTLKQVGGFDAVVVESATAALQQLRQREFDLVVSDAMMPDMNGLEFCQAASALGGRAETMPIVILSAATMDELGWKDRTDLSNGWLRKPFRPAALVEELKRVVAEHP